MSLQIPYGEMKWSGKFSTWDLWLVNQCAEKAPFAYLVRDRLFKYMGYEFQYAFQVMEMDLREEKLNAKLNQSCTSL